ncbi:MAG: hypothetical protein HUJ70_05020 [Pseudobutyrivibrio sp.]|nr:hypothetical protein [Pseudobutyrivibrio sp.]MCF0184980.1 hypothetical protein [Bacteroidaceae bacterium]
MKEKHCGPKDLTELLGSRAQDEELKSLWPLFSLILYRINTVGIQALFADDGYYPEMETTALKISSRVMTVPYLLKSVKMKPSGEETFFLEAGFLNSNRYSGFLEELQKSGHEIISDFTVTDCHLRETKPTEALDIWRTEVKHLPLGQAVASRATKLYVQKIYRLFERLQAEGKSVDTAPESKEIISKLKKNLEADINRVAAQFKKYGVKRYLSSNIFNLKTLICMEACHRIGAETIWYQHAVGYLWEPAWCYETCNLTDRVLFWCEKDRVYHEKYARPLVYTGKMDYTTEVAGCPELIYDTVKKDMEQWQAKKQVSCFVMAFKTICDSLINKGSYEEQLEIASQFKTNLFNQLVKLHEKTGAEILLRYHPHENQDTLARDQEFLKDCPFIHVVDNGRDALWRCLYESTAVLGVGSPLFLAETCGCATYYYDCVPQDKEMFARQGVNYVDLEKIANINIPDKKGEIIKENCADYNLLFN